MLWRVIFLFLVSFNWVKATCTDGSESNQACPETSENMYSESANKWSKYLAAYETSWAVYKPYNKTDCTCYAETMDKDLSLWSESGIQMDMIETAMKREMGVLYQVINHKLYRNKACMFPARCEGVEHFLSQVLPSLPDLEFVLNDRDYPQIHRHAHGAPLPIFSFSKVPDQSLDIMYPAWSFWAGGPALWPLYPTGLGRWDEHRKSLSSVAQEWPWEKKRHVAFFRGSRTSAERDPLMQLSQREPDAVDARYTKNQSWRSNADSMGMPPAEEVSMEEHCRYRYLFNLRGVAASFRLRHLFLCGSLVLHVGDQWQEFFYGALRPWVHYVPVKDDLSDVWDVLQFVRENTAIARRIAEAGERFIMDHLRMDDVICYWRRLLRKYARLMRYKVQLRPDMIPL